MSSSTVSPRSSQQPELSSQPIVPGRTVEPASFSGKQPRARRTTARREVKPKRTPACNNCRIKKLRCTHRRIIDDTGNVIPEPTPEPPTEGAPPAKRARRAVHRSVHDEVVEVGLTSHMDHDVTHSSASRPMASSSRKGKRRLAETEHQEEPVAAPSTATTSETSGSGRPNGLMGQTPAAHRNRTLNEISLVTSTQNLRNQLRQQLDAVDSQWRRTSAAVGTAHDEFDRLVECMNEVQHTILHWKEKIESF